MVQVWEVSSRGKELRAILVDIQDYNKLSKVFKSDARKCRASITLTEVSGDIEGLI
jgi:hypothetical protein